MTNIEITFFVTAIGIAVCASVWLLHKIPAASSRLYSRPKLQPRKQNRQK
jgi:hypothetical protein